MTSIYAERRSSRLSSPLFSARGPCGAFIGNTHDIGKAPPSWQNHLKKSSGYDESIAEGECDKGSHTAAGAAYALKNLPEPLNLLLAYIVAGHHAGLPDFYDSGHGESLLKRFFKDGGRLRTELLDAAQEYGQRTPPEGAAPQTFDEFEEEYIHMLVRFLFSCLVDADWLDTERFMTPENFAARRAPVPLVELRRRFDAYMGELRRSAPDTYVNVIRNQILARCTGPAAFRLDSSRSRCRPAAARRSLSWRSHWRTRWPMARSAS